jgi:hypothetical protein
MQKTILSKLDFTVNRYEELCQAIAESKYANATIAGYLQMDKGNKEKPYIILRHDIDRTPQRALDISLVEKKYGLKATYYFRESTYVTKIMDEIASYGHEIGFHYETLDRSKGNMEAAITLFQHELALFRERYEVKTVCAHGNPLTRYDNKDIWKSLSLADFGLLGEAFLALDFTRFAYFSDSGRTWLKTASQKMPGKDDVKTAFDSIKAKNTDELIEIISEGTLPNICILTHPERWCKGIFAFTSRYLIDLAFSCGKVAISMYQGGGKRK